MKILNNTNIKMELDIKGDFNIDEITHALQVRPTTYWEKGDKVNEKLNHSYTLWSYSSSAVETLDIKDAQVELEKIFIPKREILYKLKKLYNLQYTIEIIITIVRNELPAIYFENDFLEFITCIGGDIDIDMYSM